MMTEILIKSFNRPYYLDRCLTSIFQFVKGDYSIKILDDGTPEHYITKIKNKYPKAKLIFSNQVQEKRAAIIQNLADGTPINGFRIPTNLWYQEVKNSSDYVLVIEDDVWVTEHIDVDYLTNEMRKNNVPLLKLGWLGLYKDDIYYDVKPLTSGLTSVNPKKLFTANKFIMDLFMYNKLKVFTILYRLGVVDNKTKLKYWALNSILMGLYQKDYWLAIWQDAEGKVDEKQQLRNAAAWYHNNKKANFSRTETETLKTTFQSSATGSYHEYGNQFDANRMNYILNEAWLNDKLDSMESFPNDFSDRYIKQFLDRENHPDARYEDWFSWAEKFREQYRNLGAKVD